MEKAYKKLVISILLILITSILLGVFIPGVIYYQSGSFSKEDIYNKLEPINRKKIDDAALQLLATKKRKQELLQLLYDTSQSISTQQISDIKNAIENLNKIEKDTKDKSITLGPFYPRNNLLLLWPFLYSGLAMILFLVKPKYKYRIDKTYFWSIFLLLTIFVRWPTWVRNTSIGQLNRTVYSVSNYDISKTGFVVQEIQSLLSLAIISLIICKWLSYSQNLKQQLLFHTRFSHSYYIRVIKNLRSIYQEFQLCSLFLAFAFGYYTYFFWSTIHDSGDFRYVPHAIIIHIVWALVWYIISLPLIFIKNYQLAFKEILIRQQLDSSLTSDVGNGRSELFYNEDPISTQNQIVTLFVSGVAFLLPLVKAFL